MAALLAAFRCRSDDIFMHLSVGRWLAEHGRMPDPDPWLHSLSGYHRGWWDVWGAHLGAYALYRAGGFALLGVVKILLVVAGAAAPFWLAGRLRLRSALVPLVAIVALWAAADRFIERSSLLSDVLGAWVLALCLLERMSPSRRRWWILPGLFVIWTNVHLGAVTGLFFLGAVAVTEPRAWRRWLVIGGACVAACCVHPTGPLNLWYSIRNVLGGGFEIYRKHYFEFFPTLHESLKDTTQVRLFLALLVGMTGLLLWRLRRAPRPLHAVLVLGGLAYLGLSTIRFVTTAALALPVLAVALLAPDPPPAGPSGPPQTPRRLALVSVLAAAVAVVALGLSTKLVRSGYTTQSGPRRLGLGLDRDAYPYAAAALLRSVPLAGNVFNEHAFGAFLAWEWNGTPKLHYHGYVLAPRFYAEDYLGVNRSPEDFQRVVDRYRIDAFLLAMYPASPTEGPLVFQQLLGRPEWRLVFWDGKAVVFLRDRPEYQAFLATRGYRYFDPFRRERLDQGLREDPQRVLEEAVQALVDEPRNEPARRVVQQVFRLDPEALRRDALAGRRPVLPPSPPPPR
jgi:hypothetical protein